MRSLTRGPAAGLVLLALIAAACSGAAPVPTVSPVPAPGPSVPTATATATATPSAPPSAAPSPDPDEPTTTNTLPAPPAPTAAAPSTAGSLRASSLPVPAGWRTVAKAGSDEEGYRGNGTWVHARDPRYAARDVITIGCADVTRDDYPDPVAALAGDYVDRDENPGVGLALQFADAGDAGRYWARYRAQVRACAALEDPVHIEVVAAPGAGPDDLVDRRTYPDSRWTEVAARSGARITLVILTDPGHRVTPAEASRLLRQMR